MKEGRIVKALSGFYDVQSGDDVFRCKGRGVFRKRKITPLVGDFVTFTNENQAEGYITDIKPRTNELRRPPVANIDQAIIVFSVSDPEFSTLLLDRFLVSIEAKNIRPLIFISKMDMLKDPHDLENDMNVYRRIGYTVAALSSTEADDLSHLETYLTNNVSVFAGQSGVGKSTLLNRLNPELSLKTATISKSLGRGKHTTRHVELFEVYGGFVGDTPGFSALDFRDITAEQVAAYFPEIDRLGRACKFRSCRHHQEPGCAVKQAVETGEIATFRYEHYIRFYEECKNRKPRY